MHEDSDQIVRADIHIVSRIIRKFVEVRNIFDQIVISQNLGQNVLRKQIRQIAPNLRHLVKFNQKMYVPFVR